MKKLKILHISDTHKMHGWLTIPKNIDIIIHSGDASNIKSPYYNEQEMLDFIEWYSNLDIDYKIYVGGNHDTSLEKKLITKELFTSKGITYIEHESIEIEGLKIFGSPYTPEFNNWAFNVKREKLFKYWEAVPLDTQILITHGPPKYILDNDHNELLGCKSLYKKVQQLDKLIFHQFGHVHSRLRNNDTFINRGIYQQYSDGPKYINASCVDLDYRIIPGNIITEIDLESL